MAPLKPTEQPEEQTSGSQASAGRPKAARGLSADEALSLPLPGILLWSVLLFASLGWNLLQDQVQTNALIRREAELIATKDQALHHWATLHGGVYVPVDKLTQPNPELKEHQEQTITTPSGRILTLLTPNAMLKELSRLDESKGARSHLVGTAEVHRGEKPNAWEKKALARLVAGAAGVEDVERLDGQPQFRVMRPLKLEEGCRRCHTEFNKSNEIAPGTVVGAVSVSVPLSDFLIGQLFSGTWMAGTHALLWIAGLIALVVGSRRLARQIAETNRAEAEARELAQTLERRVEERATEIKGRETYLRRIMTSAADGILTVDSSNRIENCNPAGARIFGYDVLEVVGQPISLLFPSGNADVLPPVPEGNSALELEGQRKDGSLFPLSAALSRVDVGGRTLLIAVLHDLEHEKRLEAEHLAARSLAEAARRHADRANRAKSEFLSSVSHELRTPLNSIIGFAQLLVMDGGDPLSQTQKGQIRNIETAGDHLLTLINEILDLSRIEAGGIAMEIGVVETAGVLQNALDLVYLQAEQRDVTLVSRCGNPADLPKVRADALRLQQVLVNLLSNAIKYNKAGGKVVIGCGVDHGRVCLEIADTGRGIDPERMAELFQPFNRLGAEALDIEGAGIGLVISRRLVELMDGSIEVESIQGEGSVFRILLPAAHYPLEVQSGSVQGNSLAEGTAHHAVLMIESNAGTIRSVEELLSRFPEFGLISATTAVEGLRIARLCRPALIMIDANLSDMDGFELLKVVRQEPRLADVPVIGFSGSALPRDVRRGLDAGFQTFLTQPLNLTLLLDAIRLAIATQRSRAVTTRIEEQSLLG